MFMGKLYASSLWQLKPHQMPMFFIAPRNELGGFPNSSFGPGSENVRMDCCLGASAVVLVS